MTHRNTELHSFEDPQPSDPALNTEPGHDWSSEGGATPQGPATNTPQTGGAQIPVTGTGGGRVRGDMPFHERISPPVQTQEEPGLDSKMQPLADHGEQSYRGSERLRGKRALITGGDSGIGAAVALAFHREGAHVALAYLPSEESDVQTLLERISWRGTTAPPRIELFPGDLRDADYRSGLVMTAVEALGGLDILVNNAGKQISVDNIDDLTDHQVFETFDVNVFSMIALCRDALPQMSAGACIINTTSIQAYAPSAHLLDYASTKAAINAFTKGLAEQVSGRGIRVNAVAPGPIWTPLQPSHGQPPEALPTFGHDTWLGRAGQPAELASAYVFLAEDAASYITGSTIHVNGGKTSP